MPRIERTAVIVWEGNLARGAGQLTAASSGAFVELPLSLASRVGAPEGKTSPEELLAAAHGGCFAMSLAGELSALEQPPQTLRLECRVVMDEVEGQGHQIVGSQLTVVARVPEANPETFARAVELADAGCPFASLLRRAGALVEVQANLEQPG